MKELLEKWNKLEPHLCKRETRPNPFKSEDIERFDILSPYGWQTVYSHDSYYDEYNSPMKIQWAIQQAIIEKGWSYTLVYDSFYGFGNEAHVSYGTKDEQEYHYTSKELSSTEILLTVYLEVLSANP